MREIGRLPIASDDAGGSSSDGGRDLLQQRIALFGRVLLLLAVLGFAMTNLVTIAGGHAGPEFLFAPTNLAHLGGAVVLLVVWLVARGAPLGARALRVLDALGTLVPAALFDVMALHLPVDLRPDLASRHLVMMLVTTNLLIARAVLVPSRPGGTAILGALTCVPALACAALADGPGTVANRVAYGFTWSMFAVMTSTFASHVIYGLRRRMREARRLGRYTLGEKLGAGGMGVVYRAEHAMLRRPTAIKLLDANVVGEQGLARFEREVQLTAKLTHPNTVAIYDYGRTPEGIFYYAMELVDGLDLEHLVRRHGPQPAARVAHLLRQACGSLAEAHAHGLVHRDVKPSNLVVSRREGQGDVLKVLDFGLVKDSGEDGEASLSRTGAVLGTPLYLSPEAIVSPDRVGPASDLYALGAVAYYLLTGAPVFQAESVVQLCSKHLTEAPVPPSERSDAKIPAELERIVMKLLAKSPADRPVSADALAEALADAMREDGLGPWRREDADAWWRGRRATVGSEPPLSQEQALAETMTPAEAARSS